MTRTSMMALATASSDAQSQGEANAKAARQAWPATVAFLKEHTK